VTGTNFSQSDEISVTYALQGDAIAFARLIDRHAPRLKRLLLAMLGNHPEVDDLYQETVLRAFLNLEKLRDPSRFGAWIYSIAVNLARTHRGIVSPEVTWDSDPDPIHENGSPEIQLIHQETVFRIHQAISDLPQAERDAIILVYLGDLSHQEAARELGTSLSAVKVRVHRGRNHLREILRNEFVPQPVKKRKEKAMLKVVIHDIVTKPREDVPPSAEEGEKKWKVFGRAGKQSVVLLREESGVSVLPIWVGPFEAESIAIHIRKEKEHNRPLTFDLMKSLLELGQIQVKRVDIHRLHEKIFYANLVAEAGEQNGEIDCRPSDALNLAVRLGVPIFVSPEIMNTQSRTPDEEGGYLIDPQQPEIEWKSLLTE